MKNKIYRHIVLSGLLSSTSIIFGMDHDKNLTAPDSSQSHHHGLLHTIKDDIHNVTNNIHNIISHDDKQLDPLTTSNTHDIPKTKDAKHRSRSLSTSTPISPLPLHPNDPSSHHHTRLAQKLITIKKTEEKIENSVENFEDVAHNVNNTVVNVVIENPENIKAALTAVGLNEPTAQSTTGIIELVATDVQKGGDIIHNTVQKIKQKKKQQQVTDQQKTNSTESIFKKLEDDVFATQITTQAQSQNTLKKLENEILDVGENIIKDVNQHSTVATAIIGTAIGQAGAQAIINEIKKDTPNLEKEIEDLKIQPASSDNYRLIIGGTTFIVSLVSLIIILYKYNRLPNNITDFINKFISRSAVI